jgi:predicted transcriptional regulator
MPSKKIREITIEESKGVFSILKGSPQNPDYDFSGISALRQLLSNEKAKIIHVVKNQNPTSIYDLTKKLNRTFKSVTEDLKLLERFGFIEIVEEKVNNRIRHKPVLVVDSVTINLKI